VDLGRFGGSSDGEGSSGEGAWYTCAVNSDSQNWESTSIVLVCVFGFFNLCFILNPCNLLYMIDLKSKL
jgi:hypothetical protein